MQKLTEEQIELFNKLQKEDNLLEGKLPEMTEEEYQRYVEEFLRITGASSGGMFPTCAAAEASCSGC